MSNEYRNNPPPERVQINPRAAQEAGYRGIAIGAGNKSRDNTADVIIARELDALICLASQVEESTRRRLAPVSLGYPTQPDEPTKYSELPPLFNSYYYQIMRVRESLKCIQELIASVQISEQISEP